MKILIVCLVAVMAWGQTVDSSPRSSAIFTVSTLPTASSWTNKTALVTDGSAAGDCTTGGGSTRVLCVSNGTTWGAVAGGGGGFPPLTLGTHYEYDNFTQVFPSGSLGYGQLAWGINGNSGGASSSAQTPTATSIGGVQVSTGTSSFNDAEIFRSAATTLAYHSGSNFTMRTSVIGVTSDANTLYRFGLANTGFLATGTNHGIWIEKMPADTSWFGVCTNGSGSPVRTAALAAVTPGAQIAFQIRLVSAGVIGFKTASTVAGLTGASEVTITNAQCESIPMTVSYGVQTQTTVSKSLGVMWYDMQVTGLGY